MGMMEKLTYGQTLGDMEEDMNAQIRPGENVQITGPDSNGDDSLIGRICQITTPPADGFTVCEVSVDNTEYWFEMRCLKPVRAGGEDPVLRIAKLVDSQCLRLRQQLTDLETN